jgi:mRNA interferase RelE/StbE
VGKYRLTIKSSATKELESIPKTRLRQIVARIHALAENPRPHGIEKLAGEERYRIRCGDYRIVFSVDDKLAVVDVVKVGHRREVYR